MFDVECPYCNQEQYIDHHDGYGYEENVEYKQFCNSCNKIFKYTTYIKYLYKITCNEDHDIECRELSSFNGPLVLTRCKRCDFFEATPLCNNG